MADISKNLSALLSCKCNLSRLSLSSVCISSFMLQELTLPSISNKFRKNSFERLYYITLISVCQEFIKILSIYRDNFIFLHYSKRSIYGDKNCFNTSNYMVLGVFAH